MSQSDMWRWADEQGEQRLVAADELRTALASGVLPPSTLVWREGMTVWVPAISVEEFAEALPNVTGSGTVVQPVTAYAASAPTNPPALGPSRSTLQGIAARDMLVAVKAEEKDPAKDKRTPSVAPPRPMTGSGKPPLVKTLRPNVGPAIPPAPRLPSDAAKPPLAPRPVGAIRPPAQAPAAPRAAPRAQPAVSPPVPPPVPTPAPEPTTAPPPPPRAPSTSAIDKGWAITDDETTNVPGKTPLAEPRPEPPPEVAPQQQPQAHASKASVMRTAPAPSPSAELEPIDESTDTATFQFARNSLSLRAAKPPPIEESDTSDLPAFPPATPGDEPARNGPPGLMESYAKQPVATYASGSDEAPPTAPSADLGLTDDLIPAYAQTTARLESLPDPPRMREPSATAMFPLEFQEDAKADDPSKQPHEVSRTVRFAADFLDKVLAPKRSPKTVRIDGPDNAVNGALMQIKPPPLPPTLPGGQDQQFVRLQAGQPHAATSLALRQVKPPGPEAPMPAQLPMNALLVSGGLLIAMVIGSFFVGRCSVKPSANHAPTARAGLGIAVRVIQDNLPAAPKPCWVIKQPARWAPVVSKNVPFEVVTRASGKTAIGFAKSDDEAAGIEVTPMTGQVEEQYTDKATAEIARVTPMGKGFFLSTVETSTGLTSRTPVNVEKPFYLGISDKHVAWSDQPSGVANRIWPLNDEDATGGLHVFSLGNRGILAAVRTGSSRQRKVFAGMLGPDRKPLTNLVHVVGSGGSVGEPMVGSNGREVAIVFGDQAGEQSPSKVRMGHAPIGKVPSTTTVFDAPAGGPGGDANYPAIAGLSDGRWLMVWTEGSSGSKAVRAQTFAPNFTALGDPIVLSPPSGNYGASMVGVNGTYVTVVFLLKGRSNGELWGSVLQCG